MDDIVFSTTMAFASYRFDQLAQGLREDLKRIPPSGNHEGTDNLYQEFRRDLEYGCNELARFAWQGTLSDVLRPTLKSLPLPEMRLLYLATDYGGTEYAAADSTEDVFPIISWIEEEIIRRAGNLH